MDFLYHEVSHSSPLSILTLWGVLASVVLWWQARGSRRYLAWLVAPVLLLAVLSTPLAAYLARAPLEHACPPLEHRPGPCPVVVVLAGGMLPPGPGRPNPELLPATICRCLHAATLYHQGPPCPILVSGGNMADDPASPATAEVMRTLLLRLGVADADIWIEKASRSTYENAVECRKQLAQRHVQQVVLVTSAVHMYRAAACFRRQGLSVIPAPCCRRATTCSFGLDAWLPSATAASEMQETYHEWIGILAYILSDRI